MTGYLFYRPIKPIVIDRLMQGSSLNVIIFVRTISLALEPAPTIRLPREPDSFRSDQIATLAVRGLIFDETVHQSVIRSSLR